MKRDKITRNLLLFWTLFIGLGAVLGGTMMEIDPSGKAMGMDAMLPYFQVLPFSELLFQDFIFSGIALLIVNGATNLIASILIILKKKTGLILGCIFGFTLMLWIIIQFIIFPANFMSTIYFFFGLIQFITGYASIVSYMQAHEIFNIEYYPNVNKESSDVVVYFSRYGRAKKVAYEIANKSKSNIIELKTTERTEGVLGFWWCGRFAMHRWPMPLKEKYDISHFNHITIVSPIWIFGMCSPIREFIKDNEGKFNSVSLVIVHFNPVKCEKALNEMEELCKVQALSKRSFISQLGHIREIKL